MIENYLKAGFPALYLVTSEPHRAQEVIQCHGWKYFTWDCLIGISETGFKPVEEIRDPVEAVRWLENYSDSVLIAHNLHLFLELPEVIQALQNGVATWKSTGSCLVIVAPTISLSPEVEKLFTVIDLALPDEESLYALQCDIGKDTNIKPNLKAALAAKGLTELEAEAIYALSVVQENCFSTRVVSEAKGQILRKSGLLGFWEATDIEDVGGLDQLKSFIRHRSKAFEPENSHLPKLRAILLVGVPGTGKSLSSKATASLLGWPLIKLDISSLKTSLLGESERRMREALKILDSIGNAVVWCDEIEKAFAGVGSNGDSGTASAMFGTFLTWMQESKAPVVIMATANNVSNLPPEFLRSGRFDTVMFVDLPTPTEIKAIIEIMNRKYGSNIPHSYVSKLAGWTGSEIEQLAKDSLFEGLDNAYSKIVPLSRTMREEINALREWARTRTRPANTPESSSGKCRKVRGPKVNTPKGPVNPMLN